MRIFGYSLIVLACSYFVLRKCLQNCVFPEIPGLLLDLSVQNLIVLVLLPIFLCPVLCRKMRNLIILMLIKNRALWVLLGFRFLSLCSNNKLALLLSLFDWTRDIYILESGISLRKFCLFSVWMKPKQPIQRLKLTIFDFQRLKPTILLWVI